MAGDLGNAIDLLDLAVAKARDIGSDDRLEPYARVAEHVRSRLGYLGETVVLALAGGTGVGKSSLLNAIAGEVVAPAGRIRPTTDQPLAWIPSDPEPGLVRLLDDLDVEERVGHSGDLNVAILDLPDFDSISLEHKTIVERLIPRVDAILWVLDPEKYGDHSLHEGYLRPLAGYQGQFVFALNQIDRLTDDELVTVRDDLIARLAADGISNPALFATAADPANGDPAGVEQLVAFVDAALEAKRTAMGKLIEDLRRAGRGVAEVAGVEPGAGLDFDRRWSGARMTAVSRLRDLIAGDAVAEAAVKAGGRLANRTGSGPVGRVLHALRRSLLGQALGARDDASIIAVTSSRWRGRSGLEEATEVVTSTVTDLSFEAGGAFGAKLRQRFGQAEIEAELRNSAEGALSASQGRPNSLFARWWRVAAIGQWFFAVAVLVALVWGWAKPETLQRGVWPWPVILGGAAIVFGITLARVVRWSGQRAGRREAARYRADMEQLIADRVDRRIGVPLRSVMRDRAELGGALAELAIELAKLEAQSHAQRGD